MKKKNKTYPFTFNGKRYYAKVFNLGHIESDPDLLNKHFDVVFVKLNEKIAEQDKVIKNYQQTRVFDDETIDMKERMISLVEKRLEARELELMEAHTKYRSEKKRSNKLFGAVILLSLSLAAAIVSHFVF